VTSADYVRSQGWTVGTVLEDLSRPGYPRRVRITAIGEEGVFARYVSPQERSDREWSWHFDNSVPWQKVDTEPKDDPCALKAADDGEASRAR
jgi:hypothetical protein